MNASPIQFCIFRSNKCDVVYEIPLRGGGMSVFKWGECLCLNQLGSPT